MQEIEIWKDIERDKENRTAEYEVSNFGRIRNKSNNKILKEHEIYKY